MRDDFRNGGIEDKVVAGVTLMNKKMEVDDEDKLQIRANAISLKQIKKILFFFKLISKVIYFINRSKYFEKKKKLYFFCSIFFLLLFTSLFLIYIF